MKQLHLVLVGATVAALAFAVPTSAHPDHQTKERMIREIKIIKANAKAVSRAEFVANCGKGRKFESSASTGDGAKERHVNKMVICSDPGESDAQWERTLRYALARVEANTDMNPEGKAKIMADLKSEIAKLGR